MVHLTRIYTRTGDAGRTGLGRGRTRKTDPRLAAYADVDEANSQIGVAIALGALDPEVAGVLERVQHDLFDVGADLCMPVEDDEGRTEHPPLRVSEDYVTRLEGECDRWNEALPALRSFVLPGGTPGAALLHVARTVVRRAERSTWAALDEYAEVMSPLPARYLNRLSDLLFILARVANAERGDVLWVPGANR